MITYEQLKKTVSDELNIAHLPEGDQEKILARLGEVVSKRIAVDILKNLPEGKREGFKSLHESGDLLALDDYLHANLPNSDEIISGAIKTVIDSVKNR